MNWRKTLRIARWEVTKSAGNLDRRTVVIILLGTVVGAAVGPAVVSGGVALDRGLYEVGVAPESPYHAVVEEDPTFTAAPPDPEAFADGRIDVLIRDGEIRWQDSRKGRAAVGEFRSAIANYNDGQLEGEANRSAAFPVSVDLRYETRADAGIAPGSGGGGDGGSNDGTGGDGTSGAGGTGDGDADDGDGAAGTTGGGSGGPLGVPNVGGVLGGGGDGTPGELQPPFPFGSLVLAFLFIIPMNFVIQAYGSTIIDERINRRGELMLVSPVTRLDIIAGKTLPYFLALLVVTVFIAFLIGGGAVSVAAVVPLGLLFLSASFVGAMFARSFKELTFVTVTISVFLTSYAFVPAIFTEVTPIALISPLTLVVRDLESIGVSLGEYAFSTGPIYLTSGVLFLLGSGVYREEDMFTQRPVHLKAMDAIASRISGVRSIGVLSAIFIPFVFVAELLAVALLYALPIEVSLPVLLLVVATIEEVAKSIHVYTGFEYARFDRGLKTAAVVGFLSGLGFFVGEKITVITQVAGLQELLLGQTAFPVTAASAGAGTLLLLLLAPLALHTVTAGISAVGARRNRSWYVATVAVAAVVHTVYNLSMVVIVYGGF